MSTVLIACAASMAFCSLYTLILPTWDAFTAKRRKAEQIDRRTQSDAVPRRSSLGKNDAHSAA